MKEHLLWDTGAPIKGLCPASSPPSTSLRSPPPPRHPRLEPPLLPTHYELFPNTLFSDNILLDNVPQQPYAAVALTMLWSMSSSLSSALPPRVQHTLSSLTEHLSTTSSLSEALGNTMPQGSDEWTGHVAINPGNTSHHPINATYAHATYAMPPSSLSRSSPIT
ncbi:hypothetical protein BC834DRAFT_521638 [Gloeopeniophorella convolvens]|nr:hypothetical protein BC834DRAFT_521638 [Gloeopeniophorella convolvens]